jgi:hypothetical protein
MPLEFDATRAIYDEDRETVVFMATDGALLVRCCVTREALLTMAQRRARSAREMLEAYRTHSDDIHRIAQRKYRERRIDFDGSVLVLRRDIAAE